MPRRKTLTERQREVLETLKDYIEAYGYAPSSVELGTLLGCNHVVAQRHVQALERHGVVERTPGRCRAIRILALPRKVSPKRSVAEVLET